MSRWWLILLLLLAMVGAYHMPWMLHDTAVFTLNAFDLAEGASLHPTIRAESPTLFTPLQLRLSLVFIGAMMAIAATQLQDERWRWIWRGIGVLVVLRLNPPIEFYPFGDADANLNQLGYLMFGGLGLIGLIIVSGAVVRHIAGPLVLLGSIVVLFISPSGYQSAADVFESLGLTVELGGGLIIFLGLLLLVGGLAALETGLLLQQYKLKRQSKYPALSSEF